MNQNGAFKNSRPNARLEEIYMEEELTPSRSLEEDEHDEKDNIQYSTNLINELLDDYLNDDLLEQIERQYLSKNTKKNRSPISLTKANLDAYQSSHDFNIHSLLHFNTREQVPSENEHVLSPSEGKITTNTESPSSPMVIENIIKSLVNSTGSNCQKVISERYIKDVVKINKTNQMWITNISKTDMSSCTLELQSTSNTLTRKKIGPCEKVVRITIYSSINGKPKKCIISTSHHPNFGFKTICDNWIFENSSDILPDTYIIPEQNILRFLQLTFIGSHTFSNTHRVKHVSVTLEDSILSNKDYLSRVKMEINGMKLTNDNFGVISNENPSPLSTNTIPVHKPIQTSSKTNKENISKKIIREDIELEGSNPLLKILQNNLDNVEETEIEDPSSDFLEGENIETQNEDIFNEEDLEKELIQIEMKLNEKKKILDNINSPIKTIQLSPVPSKLNSWSPNKLQHGKIQDSPVASNVKWPSIATDNTVVTTKKDTKPAISFENLLKSGNTPQKVSPFKKSSTTKQDSKKIPQPSSKPIVIDFNPSFPRQPKQNITETVAVNRKPNNSLLSFINLLQNYVPAKSINSKKKEVSSPPTKMSQTPPLSTNVILEKLSMQKKLKEELDQLKHLSEETIRKEYSPPHVYTSPTNYVPFLNSDNHSEESNNNSDTSSDIILGVEEDEAPTSPIVKHESALVMDFSPYSFSNIPQRSAPSPPFRVVNDLSPKQSPNQEENYFFNRDSLSLKQFPDQQEFTHLDDPMNDMFPEEEYGEVPNQDEQEGQAEEYVQKVIVEESEIDDLDLMTMEDEVIEQFNRSSNPNSQNNSFNIEIPKEMEDFLNGEAIPKESPVKEPILPTIQKDMEIQTFSSPTEGKVQVDEESIIQSFLDTTLSSENSFALTPTKSPRLSSPLSLSIPNRDNLDSPRLELLTPSKILLKGEPSRLLRVKKGINCYVHDYDVKKKKYKVQKRILKLDRESKYLSIAKSGKSLFKKTTKIDLSKDIKWIVYGPYSKTFKTTDIIYRPFKCFSIVTQNKVFSFEVLSDGIRDVDDTILGIQYLIQDRIKSFNRPVYTKCNLIVKRYLLKKYITFTNADITIDDEMSSITSDSLASPRMMRSKSFKF